MSKNNLVVEREKKSFTMSRIFNAPREVVWNAVTSPELIPQWWGHRDAETIVDKMDVRVGGQWRFIERSKDGNEHPFNGVFKVIDPPNTFAYSFEYEPYAGHVSVDTIHFEELEDGRTRIVSVTTFDSVEDLDGMIQAGMESGATETWDRLEELVEALTAERV